MTDSQLLFLVLWLLYLAECWVWVRNGGTAFSGWGLRAGGWATAGALPGNAKGGILILNPLPPLGEVFLAEMPQFTLSPDELRRGGIEHLDRPAAGGPDAASRSLDRIRQVSHAGRDLRLDGKLFATLADEAEAGRWSALLTRLLPLPPAARAPLIRHQFRESLDADAAARRLEECRRDSRLLRGLCNLLWLWLFFIPPLVAWRVGLSHAFATALGGTLLLAWGAILPVWLRKHRARLPELREARFTEGLKMALFPPAAVRALDVLLARAMSGFHPLAVAAAVLPAAAFAGFARRVLADLEQPLPLPGALEAAAVWHREALREEVRRFLKKRGLNPESLLAPPAATDPGCTQYCPRCQTLYTELARTCPDCLDLGLAPLPGAGKKPGFAGKSARE